MLPAPRFLATLAALLLAAMLASAQQTPNREPLPAVEPLPANPVPAGIEPPPLIPDEIELKPKPAGAALPEKPAPFKLRLDALEIEPVLPPLDSTLADTGTLASALRVRVTKFRITGNHVFSERELHKLVAKYEGREISSNELEEARQAVTQKYIEAGFINSGAVLPDQNLEGGVVIMEVVEGRLTKIELSGNFWTRPWWLRHELRRAGGKPLNFNRLKQGLQLLRQDPNIRQVNAELMPGGKPGESILKADVKENQPFRLTVEASNRRPPSVGSEIIDVTFADLNLTGHSDPLVLRWSPLHSDAETADHWRYGELENIDASYRFPVTPWHTTLELRASRNDAAVVEEAFAPLDITSKSEQVTATIRQPWHESISTEFATSASLDLRKSESFLLRRPFTLSTGAVDGETRVAAIRMALEYTNRSQQHVLALRSTFSLGINEFDATRNTLGDAAGGADGVRRKVPDGQFFAWLAQAQYVRRLFNTDNLAILRLNAQLAADPLLSLEQFSLGGAGSVRGYRENQLLRDNGIFASLEVRVPVWRAADKSPILSLAPFVDFGAGWDRVEFLGKKPPKNQIDDRWETLASVGIGLIFTPSKYASAQIYWGYALNQKNRVDTGDNLQDYGLHFTLTLSAF